MQYMSIKEASEKWGITRRRIQILCTQGRIEGAQKIANAWVIPVVTSKPDDARKKTSSHNCNHDSILIEREWAMPNKNTFDIKPIRDLILDELTDGLWIDPFANKNNLATITNDLNSQYDTDYHIDALDFMKLFDSNSVDGVLYDPPYSPRQVSECYNNVGYNVTWDTTKASFWGNHKREISRIVKIGGKVITFGWNSGGIGQKYGFEIKRILLVPHGGWHNDTICTVEEKVRGENITMITAKTLNNVNKSTTTVKDCELSDIDNELIKRLKALPENFWDFKEDDTREYTHGIHSYPAMMVCPISRNILRLVKECRPVQSVFDPFSGSGTVLVEAMLSKVAFIAGNDINPLALFLSKVKTTPLNINDVQIQKNELYEHIASRYTPIINNIISVDSKISEKFDLTIKDGWGNDAPVILSEYCNENNLQIDIPTFKNIGYWFKPRVIIELSIIKNQIMKISNSDIRNFFLVAFSESIRLVSNRRNGEFKMFRMPVQKVEKFEPDVLREFKNILERNIEKMNSFSEVYNDLGIDPNVNIYHDNACSLEHLPNDTFDLIITSPPYGDSRTTVAYGEFSRLSLQWLDLFNLTDKEIMGLDKSLMGGSKYRNGFEYNVHSESLRRSLEKIKDTDLERAGDVYSFYDDLEKSISSVSKKTKKGGYQFWVVGNRTVKNENLKTDKIIAEIAIHYNLVFIYDIERNISNKVMPSKNSPSNISGETSQTMCNEHIIVLKKI